MCACRVEGTPTWHCSQLLPHTGLLIPPARESPDSSFLLPPSVFCHWDPTQPFPCVGVGQMELPVLSSGTHGSARGPAEWKPLLDEMGLPMWDSECVTLLFSVLPAALTGACSPPLPFVGPELIREWHQRTQKGHKALTPPLISRLSLLSPPLAAL